MLKISGKIRCKINFTPFVPPPPCVTPNSHLCAYCIEFTFPHLADNKPSPAHRPTTQSSQHPLTPSHVQAASPRPRRTHTIHEERRTVPAASNSVSSGLPNGSTGIYRQVDPPPTSRNHPLLTLGRRPECNRATGPGAGGLLNL